MRNILVLIAMLFLQSTVSWGSPMESPTETVYEFIKDYYHWNTDAMELSEKENDSNKSMQMAEDKYQELLRKYCLPDFRGEPIAFSGESSHEPGKEIIVSVKVTKDNAVIITKHTGANEFIADYEYRLIKKGWRWYLVAVDYVAEGQKYPGL